MCVSSTAMAWIQSILVPACLYILSYVHIVFQPNGFIVNLVMHVNVICGCAHAPNRRTHGLMQLTAW